MLILDRTKLLEELYGDVNSKDIKEIKMDIRLLNLYSLFSINTNSKDDDVLLKLLLKATEESFKKYKAFISSLKEIVKNKQLILTNMVIRKDVDKNTRLLLYLEKIPEEFDDLIS